ncbi:hypothetical protein TrRE_jg9033 [Triparma retinervis]|uniref:YEATS domain-containing protein n=1 Tax=Triparma retinervis TaxID=2557542 RepID=A0A9W6ZU14_9STRA|nr:hypothetical protein TrRE_jg9033 [Triparma retinervis]
MLPGSSDVAAGGLPLLSAVKSVSFHLHPSFPQPIRVVETPNMPPPPPQGRSSRAGQDDGDNKKEAMAGWMVEEDGWGEFEAMIKINWNSGLTTTLNIDAGAGSGADGGQGSPKKLKSAAVSSLASKGLGKKGGKQVVAEEKPLVIKHPIRLYPQGTTGPVGVPMEAYLKQADLGAVVHEYYDEVVFTDPTKGFYDRVMGRNRSSSSRSPPMPTTSASRNSQCPGSHPWSLALRRAWSTQRGETSTPRQRDLKVLQTETQTLPSPQPRSRNVPLEGRRRADSVEVTEAHTEEGEGTKGERQFGTEEGLADSSSKSRAASMWRASRASDDERSLDSSDVK